MMKFYILSIFPLQYFLWVLLALSSLIYLNESKTSWSGCEGRIFDKNSYLIDDLAIDFTHVDIKLINSQGYLKQKVSCAPTGYYSIPIDEENCDYKLKIVGPQGWHFSPLDYEVRGTCDGPKDFIFEGFTVIGQVSSKYSGSGVGGIQLSLYQKGLLISTTTTIENGRYTYEHVLPGEIVIKVDQTPYHFEKESICSKVMDNTLYLDEQFVIDGYPVQGSLKISEGLHDYPISQGTAIIIPTGYAPIEGICQLHNSEIEEKIPGALFTQTDAQGKFTFNKILIGSYSLFTCAPSYIQKPTTAPFPYTFEVTDSKLEIEDSFQIVSFTQFGTVMSKDGTLFDGAWVTIDDTTVVSTDLNGVFYVENSQPGFHKISVDYPNVYFEDQNEVFFSYISEKYIEIFSTAYDICGVVHPSQEINQLDQNFDPLKQTLVRLTHSNGQQVFISAEQGTFCFKVKPGIYSLSLVPAADQKWPYLYKPSSTEITVTDFPLKNINFYQETFDLIITTSNLEPDHVYDRFVLSKYKFDGSTSSINLSFKKGDIYKLHPGKYSLSIDSPKWCLKTESQIFETAQDPEIKVHFEQTGFKYVGNLSDPVSFIVMDDTGLTNFTQSYNFDPGLFSLCLPHANNFMLIPDKCHLFAEQAYILEYNSSSPINIELIEKSLRGQIKVPETLISSLLQDINIYVNTYDEKGTILASTKAQFNPHTSTFDYQMWIDKNLNFQALRPVLVDSALEVKFSPTEFYPCDLLYNFKECLTIPQFELKSGTFFHIKFDQPFVGECLVKLINSLGKVEYQQNIRTDLQTSKVGPIFDTLEMPLKAHIDGYHLNEVEPQTFLAFKISNLYIEFNLISEDNSETKIQDGSLFLTSLDNTKFKYKKIFQNTHESSFDDIPAGNYLLQIFSKEYAFEPSQFTITLHQGENQVIKANATRVSYSCYGRISSFFSPILKYEAFTIEAQNNEHGSVESDIGAQGNFTLRGLAPDVDYHIAINTKNQMETRLYRFSPPSYFLNLDSKDHFDLLFHITPSSYPNISGVVCLKPSDKIVSVTIHRKGFKKPFATQQIHLGNYFEFINLPSDTYTLKVNLGQASNQNSQKSSEIFEAPDISYDQNSLYFDVPYTRELPDEEEIPSTKVASTPIIYTIILGFLFYRYLIATELDKHLINYWNTKSSKIKAKKR